MIPFFLLVGFCADIRVSLLIFDLVIMFENVFLSFFSHLVRKLH